MPWIKRNLFFVAGGLVALALMGFAAFYLFSNISHNSAVTEELNQQISELNRLYSMDPHPGTETVDNIAAIKQEQQRIREFLRTARKLFVPVPPYEKTNDKGFNNLLLNTIYQLQTSASNAGVVIPPQYQFTFAAQSGRLSFTPGSIEPWTAQLSEIKTLCSILYDARINALEGLRRVPVSQDDPPGTADYLATTIVTNDISIVTPYEVTFRSFSGELAAVVDGIVRSTNCLIIKTINVEPSKVPILGMPDPGMNPNYPAYNPGYPAPRSYAPSVSAESVLLGGAPAAPVYRPIPSQAGGRQTASTAPVVFQSEKPLRVTLLIDVVKLKPPQ